LTVVDEDDFSAPFASGSNPPDGMAIVPCSVGTLGRIASGVSGNLIERSADVCLKERKRLLLVVRETPLNVIHLRNMETLAVSGAVIMPASPGYYHRPETAYDLVDFIVERVASLLGEAGALSKKWGEKEVFK
jgi:4-hydroxy-3-polyprenylbenzoate decarboxylase